MFFQCSSSYEFINVTSFPRVFKYFFIAILRVCLNFISTERDLLQMSQDKRYAYITYHDLHTIRYYKDKTVFAVKAPPGTQLQVPQEVKEQVNFCQSCMMNILMHFLTNTNCLTFSFEKVNNVI